MFNSSLLYELAALKTYAEPALFRVPDVYKRQEHIRREGLEKQIECRRSNGMEKLEPGEVDTLMIAGMGGPLMIDILKARPEVLEKVQTLVLQPQSEIGFVRERCV